jgi:hypothetical protein
MFLILLLAGIFAIARLGKLGATAVQKLARSTEVAALVFLLLLVVDLPFVVHSMWLEEHDAKVGAEALLQSNAVSAERGRCAALLSKVRQEYILSHDGITPKMAAGLESPPSDWTNERLRQLGENCPVAR